MASVNATKVLQLVNVDEDGLVHFGPLDKYMRAFGVDEDTADAMLDDIIDELEYAGIWEDYGGLEYDVEVLMEYDEREAEWEAEQERDRQQYLNDIEAAWRAAKGIR